MLDRDEVEVHENARKNEVNIHPLTEQAWSIKDLSHDQKVTPSVSFNAPVNVSTCDFQNQP